VPEFDVTGDGLVSLVGEVLSFRPDPETIETAALIRWCASSGYNEDTLRWEPTQYGILPIDITMVTDHIPTLLADYEYRVGQERFYQDAIFFDAEIQHYLSLDLGPLISGQGLTVIMVLSPNNPRVVTSGLFTNVRPTGGPFTDALIQGNYVYIETESQERIRAAPISNALNSNAPLYLALVLDRPNSITYSGPGPNSVQVVSVPSGDAGVAIASQWYIGRTVQDLTKTSDMALFDFGVYPQRLSQSEVQTEFAKLSQAYGGDS